VKDVWRATMIKIPGVIVERVIDRQTSQIHELSRYPTLACSTWFRLCTVPLPIDGRPSIIWVIRGMRDGGWRG
jgi:hypothetical protein